MFKFYKLRKPLQFLFFTVFCCVEVFSYHSILNAKVFNYHDFHIRVFGYPKLGSTSPVPLKRKVRVYLKKSDGKKIKFCHFGDGTYVPNCKPKYCLQEGLDTQNCPNGQLNLDQNEKFTIIIKDDSGQYYERDINFLRNPQRQKATVELKFFLFAKSDNLKINDKYNTTGVETYLRRGLIDSALSYYEIAEKKGIDNIKDIDVKKEIIYNLGRAQLDAWKSQNYETCKEDEDANKLGAYAHFDELLEIMIDRDNKLNITLKRELIKIGLITKNEDMEPQVEENVWCSKKSDR